MNNILFLSGSGASPLFFVFGQNGPLLGAGSAVQASVVSSFSEVKPSDASKGKETLIANTSHVKAEVPLPEVTKTQNPVPVPEEAASLPVPSGVRPGSVMSNAQLEVFRTRLIGEMRSCISSSKEPVVELMQWVAALEEIMNRAAWKEAQWQVAVMDKLESVQKKLHNVREEDREKQSVSPEPRDAPSARERRRKSGSRADMSIGNGFPDRDYERVGYAPERISERNRRQRQEPQKRRDSGRTRSRYESGRRSPAVEFKEFAFGRRR